MLHIADAEDGWFRYAVTHELEKWSEQYCLENFPTKEDIKSALAAVHARSEQHLESFNDAKKYKDHSRTQTTVVSPVIPISKPNKPLGI